MWRRGLYFDVGCQSFEDMGIVFPLLEQYGLSDLARFRRARYRIVMPGLDAVVESLPQMRRAWASPLVLARHVEELRTLMLGDFTEWYERQLPPSGVRDILSRCGYSRMNVFVASAFWHLWAHDYWYPQGGLQPWIDRWVARLRERGVQFLFKRTATALEQRGDRATAVVTQRGERLQASEIV